MLRSDAPVPEALGPMPPGGPLGELITRLLWQRGIASAAAAEAFLEPTLAQGLRPPTALPGLDVAATQVLTTLASDGVVGLAVEPSLDGLAAAASLVSWLHALGAEAIVGEGDVQIAIAPGRLAVDGRPIEGGTLGLDVAGVAFYLLIELRRQLRDRGRPVAPDLRAQLDLTALGALAAGSTLRDEERVLTALGLRRMHDAPRPGLAALVDSALIARPTARAVVTRVLPRLAATVALGHPDRVLSLLLATDAAEATALARTVELDSARWRTTRPSPEPDAPSGTLVIDADWSLAAVTPRMGLALSRLEPHGPGNPEPVLVARSARLDGARLAGDPTDPFWRLRLRQDSRTVRAVARRLGSHEIVVGATYDVAYSPRLGHVRGGGAVDVVVHDLRATPGP